MKEELNADRHAPSKEILKIIIDNYFLYEECGFFKLYNQENEIIKLEEEAKAAADVIIEESKEAAKKVVNSGSKKLVKFFEDLEQKTRTK